MEWDVFVLVSSDVAGFPAYGTSCYFLAYSVDQVVVWLVWLVILMIKNGSDTRLTIASDLNCSVLDIVDADKCFHNDNNSKYTCYFALVGVLFVGMTWCHIGPKDAFRTGLIALQHVSCGAELVLVRAITHGYYGALDNGDRE
jgi:hypothetical protein